ncbi:MAG: (Fe-S)-binding protein [Methanomassiliicoccales archaeon]|nr:(Fe-S)-binding protein [Methanomassiliicoccales archaeon]
MTTYRRLEKYYEPLEYCIRCGFCKANCPSFKQIGWDSASARGRMTAIKAMMRGEIDPDEGFAKRLFTCTTCGDCELHCPPGVKTVEAIEAARAELVDRGLGSEKHKKILQRIREEHNPYGEKNADKNRFRRDAEGADVLYFMGCTAPFRSPNTVIATMDILDAAGVKYKVIGEDEWCCGSVLRRTGFVDEAEKLREHNVEQFKRSGVKTVVTSCAGCFRAIKKEYGIEDIEILHITQYVDKLIDEGLLKLRKSREKVTYHDPCHLGKHMGVYDAPRNVLRKVATLVEMEHCRENSMCCGAGGGVKSAYGETATGVGATRMDEAKITGAKLVVTPCPFCKTNLSDSSKCLPVVDFAEYVASKLKKGE